MSAALITLNAYRNWAIWRGRWPEPEWNAASPNYEAFPEGEGEWCDNGQKADGRTRDELIANIDAWFDENPSEDRT